MNLIVDIEMYDKCLLDLQAGVPWFWLAVEFKQQVCDDGLVSNVQLFNGPDDA